MTSAPSASSKANASRCNAEADGDLAEQHRWEAAVEALTTAIEIDPSKAAGFNDRGEAYIHLFNLDLAIADLTKAIELDPRLATAFSNRAEAYLRQGKKDLAIADLTSAIDLDPTLAKAFSVRASVYAIKWTSTLRSPTRPRRSVSIRRTFRR